jgi:hypothetical protein
VSGPYVLGYRAEVTDATACKEQPYPSDVWFGSKRTQQRRIKVPPSFRYPSVTTLELTYRNRGEEPYECPSEYVQDNPDYRR